MSAWQTHVTMMLFVPTQLGDIIVLATLVTEEMGSNAVVYIALLYHAVKVRKYRRCFHI